ncbi:MAG: FtsX-like permease family protein, partial [Actinomycetales bacterium]|nr:FtsX-like permease family protein [Actinomycetales bacterium]
ELPTVGIDPGAFGRSLDVEEIAGSMASMHDGEVAVRETDAKAHGWHVGDELTVRGELGEQVVRIGAVQNTGAMDAAVLLPEDVFAELAPPTYTFVAVLMVSGEPGVAAQDVRAGLVDTVAPFVVLSVLDGEEFASSLAAQVGQVLVILYALLGLSIVIAVLGIVNTLALSIIERTREIGLLRAVGLGRLQLAGTVTIESVLTAVFGTLVGVAVGVGLATTLPRVFADEGLSVLSVPAAALGATVGLAAVVGVLAALWPAVRAARLPVLDAVSYE